MTAKQAHFSDITHSAYQAGGITYRYAGSEDDAQLRQLLAGNAMPSWVDMAMTREPCYFDGANLMGETATVIAHDQQGNSVGMYSCNFMQQHINAKPMSVGYLGGLRVNPAYRHKLRILRQGYDSIRPLMSKYRAELWMTSIASENTPARRLLEAGVKGMPRYTPVGELDTLAISSAQGRALGILQAARDEDIPALVAFYNQHATRYQFSPVLEATWLKNLAGQQGLSLQDFYLLKQDETIYGCIALWDQRKFKQVVARAYRFPLNYARHAYNLWAKTTGRICLPHIREPLNGVYLAFAVLPAGSDQALSMLRDAIYKIKQKGAGAAILSLSPAHPLHAMIIKTLKPACYRSYIETVNWPDETSLILNTQAVQPEAALL